MDQTRLQLDELINKSSLSEEEIDLLYQYLCQSDSPELRSILLEKFADDLSGKKELVLPSAVSEKMLREITWQTAMSITPVKRFTRKKIMVAASVVFVLLSATFFVRFLEKSPQLPVAVAKVIRTDVAAPITSRATIILGNGEQILLDSNNNGMLARQGEVNIEKTANGSISYSGTASQAIFNTLFNPRGSKPVSLTLSDGSKVWLNSESSLRYPAAFTKGKDREVEVTGEAYFEVQKNASMPFRVSVAGKGTVEVLGTHFNINSYGDESNTSITLLEGSVRVLLSSLNTNPKGNTVVIQPGQQALYTNGMAAPTIISVKKQVDVNAVMAWKNGYFNFDNADLYMVMRQLARWYNMKLKYEGKIRDRTFGGEMQRDLNLSEVLKVLEKNNIHFTIENDQLIVRP